MLQPVSAATKLMHNAPIRSRRSLMARPLRDRLALFELLEV
ncbi:MAG: hypothetical protein ABSG43_15425 [Solirubrobacteraceae bacterium]|jgi:hypothetical protein